MQRHQLAGVAVVARLKSKTEADGQHAAQQLSTSNVLSPPVIYQLTRAWQRAARAGKTQRAGAPWRPSRRGAASAAPKPKGLHAAGSKPRQGRRGWGHNRHIDAGTYKWNQRKRKP